MASSKNYVRVSVWKEGVTVEQLCAHEDLPFTPGCGFYLLVNPEPLGPNKVFVAWDGTKYISEGVREALNLEKGSVTISPSHFPKGHELFVQSTSPSRKLNAGMTMLLAVPVDVAAQHSTRKRKAEDAVSTEPSAKRATTWTPHARATLNWAMLYPDSEAELEQLCEENAALECDQAENFCDDEAVPAPLIADLTAKLTSVFERIQWEPKPQIEVRNLPAPLTFRIWSSHDDGSLMQAVTSKNENTGWVAFDAPGEVGVAVGTLDGRTFVHTSLFHYETSEGSAKAPIPDDEAISPSTILAIIIREVGACVNIDD